MKHDAGPLDLHFLKLDLQVLQSVKVTAAEFMSKEPRLDLLINNAGVSFIVPLFESSLTSTLRSWHAHMS